MPIEAIVVGSYGKAAALTREKNPFDAETSSESDLSLSPLLFAVIMTGVDSPRSEKAPGGICIIRLCCYGDREGQDG